MPQYYGVARSSEYLAHYGVKGMKWGVRRAMHLADGQASDRALRKQRIKAEKKLNKLMKLGTNKDKYKKRAIAYGLGAAKLGGLAAAGTSGIGSAITRTAARRATNMQNLGFALQRLSRTNSMLKNTTQGNAIYNAGKKLVDNSIKSNSGIYKAGNAVQAYGKNNTIGKRLSGSDVNSALRKITNEQYLRGAAALGAAGLGVAAARNAYRAKTADRNIIRAAQFKAEMDRAFAGTKYANGVSAKKRRRARG